MAGLSAFLRRSVRRPFKGAAFYEWQIGPVVLQVRHDTSAAAHFRRVHVWIDRTWTA